MMDTQRTVQLRLRSQALGADARGYTCWTLRTTNQVVPVDETAIIICDMWDNHWSRGAAERAAALAPRMNQVVTAARARGVQIIHAPSDTMPFYSGTPARQRVIEAPRIDPPPSIEHPEPPLPIDAADGGSDTGEAPWHRAWRGQHPAIAIDQAQDAISDDGTEIYSFICQRRIRRLLIMGVHTNMCVLGRSFAIKQMVTWGLAVALVRDLTDALYNPTRPPYVSHDAGTRLVIAYIEKFWCPTIASADLTGDGARSGTA